MISCEEATKIVIKKQIEPLSFWDRMRLWMHLSMCKFCSLFEKQNRMIDEASSKLDEVVPTHMHESIKTRLLQEIQK